MCPMCPFLNPKVKKNECFYPLFTDGLLFTKGPCVCWVVEGGGSTCLNHIIIREKATEVQDDAFDFPYSSQLRQNLILISKRAKGLNPGKASLL